MKTKKKNRFRSGQTKAAAGLRTNGGAAVSSLVYGFSVTQMVDKLSIHSLQMIDNCQPFVKSQTLNALQENRAPLVHFISDRRGSHAGS